MITLYEGEHIVHTVRKHWFVIFLNVFIFLVLAILPLIGGTFLQSYIIGNAYSFTVSPHLINFLYVAWLLLLWVFFSVSWTFYALTIVIITDRRLIDIDQPGLFARDVSEMRLENIQDMKVEIMGVIPSLLKFGNIVVQSAGESQEFIIDTIPDPLHVKDTISELRNNMAAHPLGIPSIKPLHESTSS